LAKGCLIEAAFLHLYKLLLKFTCYRGTSCIFATQLNYNFYGT
jgi:hypothetical protein